MRLGRGSPQAPRGRGSGGGAEAPSENLGYDRRMPGPPPIEVRDLVKRWVTRDGTVAALGGVSLSVAPQEFLTVLGPSGCGKSTLLSIIGGLIPPDAGEVRLEGLPSQGPDPRRVAMVFQDPGLFPWRTALANVEFGLELWGVPPARRRERARALLERVGLRGFEARYPRELSGGMKQRVAIARALALDTPILLMDEPFAALDEQTRLLMGEWLLDIWAGTRKTVVFVTHSLQEAILLSQRIVVMTARPGRIKATFDVRLPPPRDPNGPDATVLRAALWAEIREESLRAQEASA
jgi:NitT/TauT family transport system ATP-binding protein